jgi:integrase
MPRLVHRFPAYRHHKASGQAVVTLGGKDVYLGPHGTELSKANYDRALAEWLAGGRSPSRRSSVAQAGLTVGELIVRYWTFARRHYRRDGEPTRELDNIRDALRPLCDHYRHLGADRFGPVALKTVRQAMIDAGLARTTINFRVSKIRRTFRWAAANELVPAGVYHGLMTVTGLLPGRDGVRDSEPVKPVPEAHIAAVRPLVSKPIRAMIDLQALTGMRPGEVMAMRGVDIDRSGAVWVYRPSRHKTQGRGGQRAVPLGPQAQAVLSPWLGNDPLAYLFSPATAVAIRNARRREERKTPMTPSQARRRPKRHPRRAPGKCYNKNAYGQAILRACKKANIPRWHPNQLRHTAATRFRERYGIEAARQLLGHRSTAPTEIYAEADLGRVVGIMAEIG